MKKLMGLPIYLLICLFSCTHKPQYRIDPNGLKENGELAKQAPYVLLISIDGFRYDYIDKYAPPYLSQFNKKGVQAKGLTPVFPSKTFTNHYSLITGLYPENHGIISNEFYDKSRNQTYSLRDRKTVLDGSWYGGEPLWLTTSKNQLISASFFWVGSDAPIQGHHPTYYYNYNHSEPNDHRTEQIENWLRMPENVRPHFLTLYFSLVDSAGHEFGPNSPETREAVLKVDKLIQDLDESLSSLGLPLYIVIVSDHGMEQIDSNKFIFLGDTIDLSKTKVIGRGPFVSAYYDDFKQREADYQKLKNIPLLKVYKRESSPYRFHLRKNPRAGDLILFAEPEGYIFPEASSQDPKKMPKASPGQHGYDPLKAKNMDGIFLAKGPKIKQRGMINSFKNIHVYPFILKILGINNYPKIDGQSKVLAPLLD